MNTKSPSNNAETQSASKAFELDGCYRGPISCEPGTLTVLVEDGEWLSGDNGPYLKTGARLCSSRFVGTEITSLDDSNLVFVPNPGECERVGLPPHKAEHSGTQPTSEKSEDQGQQLVAAVSMLMRAKSSLMHQRRFGQDTLQGYRTACTSVEGDIEQWLIENGHLLSKE